MQHDPPDLGRYKGRPLRSFLQALVDYLRGSRVIAPAGSGLTAHATSGGTLLLPEGMPLAMFALSPAGGIASGADEYCQFYHFDSSDAATASGASDTVLVHNPYASAVGSSKRMWIIYYEGKYRVATEGC